MVIINIGKDIESQQKEAIIKQIQIENKESWLITNIKQSIIFGIGCIALITFVVFNINNTGHFPIITTTNNDQRKLLSETALKTFRLYVKDKTWNKALEAPDWVMTDDYFCRGCVDGDDQQIKALIKAVQDEMELEKAEDAFVVFDYPHIKELIELKGWEIFGKLGLRLEVVEWSFDDTTGVCSFFGKMFQLPTEGR
eukprot:536550_1